MKRPAAVRMWSEGGGFNLIELVIVLAVILIAAVVATPNVLRWSAGLRVRLAASELVGELMLARGWAIRHSANVGVKFRIASDGRVTYTLYRDGDGDGVRTRDIESGVDPQAAPPRQLRHLGRHVRFGFPPGPAPRDPGDPSRRLENLDDPIRFNRSDIASFSPLGGSTPGSLYITDSQYHLTAVRLYGRTGKVRTIRYDPVTESWR